MNRIAPDHLARETIVYIRQSPLAGSSALDCSATSLVNGERHRR